DVVEFPTQQGGDGARGDGGYPPDRAAGAAKGGVGIPVAAAVEPGAQLPLLAAGEAADGLVIAGPLLDEGQRLEYPVVEVGGHLGTLLGADPLAALVGEVAGQAGRPRPEEEDGPGGQHRRPGGAAADRAEVADGGQRRQTAEDEATGRGGGSGGAGPAVGAGRGPGLAVGVALGRQERPGQGVEERHRRQVAEGEDDDDRPQCGHRNPEGASQAVADPGDPTAVTPADQAGDRQLAPNTHRPDDRTGSGHRPSGMLPPARRPPQGRTRVIPDRQAAAGNR